MCKITCNFNLNRFGFYLLDAASVGSLGFSAALAIFYTIDSVSSRVQCEEQGSQWWRECQAYRVSLDFCLPTGGALLAVHLMK